MSTPQLPNPRRHITDTNPEGKAVFSTKVDPSLGVSNTLGSALSRLAWVTPGPISAVDLNSNSTTTTTTTTTTEGPASASTSPVSTADDIASYATALTNLPPLVPPGGGTIVWYVDTPPGGTSPMHRTASFDIAIQVAGELELRLDGGETRRLRPGDMTVQRATMHQWHNPSATEWSRMVGIMTECAPVVRGGVVLGTEFPRPPGKGE